MEDLKITLANHGIDLSKFVILTDDSLFEQTGLMALLQDPTVQMALTYMQVSMYVRLVLAVLRGAGPGGLIFAVLIDVVILLVPIFIDAFNTIFDNWKTDCLNSTYEGQLILSFQAFANSGRRVYEYIAQFEYNLGFTETERVEHNVREQNRLKTNELAPERLREAERRRLATNEVTRGKYEEAVSNWENRIQRKLVEAEQRRLRANRVARRKYEEAVSKWEKMLPKRLREAEQSRLKANEVARRKYEEAVSNWEKMLPKRLEEAEQRRLAHNAKVLPKLKYLRANSEYVRIRNMSDEEFERFHNSIQIHPDAIVNKMIVEDMRRRNELNARIRSMTDAEFERFLNTRVRGPARNLTPYTLQDFESKFPRPRPEDFDYNPTPYTLQDIESKFPRPILEGYNPTPYTLQDIESKFPETTPRPRFEDFDYNPTPYTLEDFGYNPEPYIIFIQEGQRRQNLATGRAARRRVQREVARRRANVIASDKHREAEQRRRATNETARQRYDEKISEWRDMITRTRREMERNRLRNNEIAQSRYEEAVSRWEEKFNQLEQSRLKANEVARRKYEEAVSNWEKMLPKRLEEAEQRRLAHNAKVLPKLKYLRANSEYVRIRNMSDEEFERFHNSIQIHPDAIVNKMIVEDMRRRNELNARIRSMTDAEFERFLDTRVRGPARNLTPYTLQDIESKFPRPIVEGYNPTPYTLEDFESKFPRPILEGYHAEPFTIEDIESKFPRPNITPESFGYNSRPYTLRDFGYDPVSLRYTSDIYRSGYINSIVVPPHIANQVNATRIYAERVERATYNYALAKRNLGFHAYYYLTIGKINAFQYKIMINKELTTLEELREAQKARGDPLWFPNLPIPGYYIFDPSIPGIMERRIIWFESKKITIDELIIMLDNDLHTMEQLKNFVPPKVEDEVEREETRTEYIVRNVMELYKARKITSEERDFMLRNGITTLEELKVIQLYNAGKITTDERDLMIHNRITTLEQLKELIPVVLQKLYKKGLITIDDLYFMILKGIFTIEQLKEARNDPKEINYQKLVKEIDVMKLIEIAKKCKKLLEDPNSYIDGKLPKDYEGVHLYLDISKPPPQYKEYMKKIDSPIVIDESKIYDVLGDKPPPPLPYTPAPAPAPAPASAPAPAPAPEQQEVQVPEI